MVPWKVLSSCGEKTVLLQKRTVFLHLNEGLIGQYAAGWSQGTLLHSGFQLKTSWLLATKSSCCTTSSVGIMENTVYWQKYIFALCLKYIQQLKGVISIKLQVRCCILISISVKHFVTWPHLGLHLNSTSWLSASMLLQNQQVHTYCLEHVLRHSNNKGMDRVQCCSLGYKKVKDTHYVTRLREHMSRVTTSQESLFLGRGWGQNAYLGRNAFLTFMASITNVYAICKYE
jgi:hypothetical protein